MKKNAENYVDVKSSEIFRRLDITFWTALSLFVGCVYIFLDIDGPYNDLTLPWWFIPLILVCTSAVSIIIVCFGILSRKIIPKAFK